VALGEPDIEVRVAIDGAHALRTALVRPPDVVLVDIGLPVLDASGFVEQWCERAPAARSVPLIAMSGLPYGRAVSEKIGAAAFFAKPFDIALVARTVRALAARRPHESPSA